MLSIDLTRCHIWLLAAEKKKHIMRNNYIFFIADKVNVRFLSKIHMK